MKWGSSTFKLLGITFDLVLNYKPRLKEIENTINRWSKQTLTPFGKITIIKTLIISKLNHLFLAIPGPDENMMCQLTNKIYSFIWDDKPDKVTKDLISQDYCWGGLKMINLKAFIQGLELTWVRRLFHSESNWVKLYKYSEKVNFTELAYLGSVKASKNKFWKEVFVSWNNLKELHLPRYPGDVLSTSLWNNNSIKVGNSMVYYKMSTKRGIWMVNDLIDNQGNIMSFQDFQQTYNLRPIFLQFYGIPHSVKKWLHSTGVNVHEKNPWPLIPFNIGIFLKPRKGSKDMYNFLNRKTVQISAEQKWENILNKYDIEWKNIHFHCTKHTKNTKLCWFQYRIIHRILGTNTFLYKIKVKDCNLCTFCKEERETIEHLLWECHKISDLWHELNRWIFEMTCIEIPLNLEIAMFGLLHPYDANLFKNKIILF